MSFKFSTSSIESIISSLIKDNGSVSVQDIVSIATRLNWDDEDVARLRFTGVTIQGKSSSRPISAPKKRVRQNDRPQRIFDFMDGRKTYTIDDVYEAVGDGVTKNAVAQTMHDMVKKGKLKRVSLGQYKRVSP